MTDYRPYCLECKVRMICETNEVEVPYGDGVQFGDAFVCPGSCNAYVVVGFGEPVYKSIKTLPSASDAEER